MPQYWSKECPCAYCPATDNVSHELDCIHYGVYNEEGRLIPFQVMPKDEQLQFDLGLPTFITRKRIP